MRGPTPDQLRTIDKLVADFEAAWYLDVGTKEIRLKPMSISQKLRSMFWKKRYPVFALYHWAKDKWLLGEFNRYPFPIDHDNMPIRGFPMKCELQGGWTIPQSDLKHLIKGPLASEGLNEILVPAALGWQRLWLFIRQYAPVVGTIAATVGTVARYWPELSALYAMAF